MGAVCLIWPPGPGPSGCRFRWELWRKEPPPPPRWLFFSPFGAPLLYRFCDLAACPLPPLADLHTLLREIDKLGPERRRRVAGGTLLEERCFLRGGVTLRSLSRVLRLLRSRESSRRRLDRRGGVLPLVDLLLRLI